MASLGFDDHGWLSDSDLKWLVDSGQTDLLNARAAAQELRAKRSGQEAQGARFDERELQKAEKEEIDLAELLRPYEEEYREGPALSSRVNLPVKRPCWPASLRNQGHLGRTSGIPAGRTPLPSGHRPGRSMGAGPIPTFGP